VITQDPKAWGEGFKAGEDGLKEARIRLEAAKRGHGTVAAWKGT
jgi:hypothetical protein